MSEGEAKDVTARELMSVWTVALVTGLLISLYAIFLYPSNEWDSIRRYAPMAEEFALGNWRYAFHPRFGLSFQVLTGILVALTKMSGLAACQTVASFSWTLSTVPLWSAVRRTFGRVAAWWSVLFVLLSSTYFTLAVNGWRDDLRILVVALWVLGVVRIGTGWGTLWMSLGLVMGTTLREDALPFSCLVCGGYVLVLWCRKAFLRALLPMTATLFGVLGICTMIYLFTGYFVPSQKLVCLLSAPQAVAVSAETAATSAASVADNTLVANVFDPGYESMKPSFVVLSVIAVAMAAFRLWRRQFGRFDLGVLAIAFGGSLYLYVANFCFFGVWGSFWRYHYPAYAPLLAYPAVAFAAGMGRWPRAKIVAVFCAVLSVVGFVILEVYRPVKHLRKPEKYAKMAQYAGCLWAADRIKADWRGPARDNRPVGLLEYNTNRRPYVAACWPLVGYRAGGRPSVDHVRLGEEIVPDYWLMVSGTEYEDLSTKYVIESNLDGEKELVDTYRIRDYEFKLYRHVETKDGK